MKPHVKCFYRVIICITNKCFVGCTLTKLQGTGEITYCRFSSFLPHEKQGFSYNSIITSIPCFYISFLSSSGHFTPS